MPPSNLHWSIEKRKINELKDYHKNPRKMTKRQAEDLQSSLSKFGIIDKPFINRNGVLIGGHQRVRTLKKMGYKEIDVQVPNRDLTESEVEELNIRHNKNIGEWDWDILANEWSMDDLVSWGFTLEELNIDLPGTDDEKKVEEVVEPSEDYDVQWISVKDRLPEEGERVLIYQSWEDEIEVDLLYSCPTPVWGCQLHDDHFKVTHWAKLPRKPKNVEYEYIPLKK